MKVLVAEDNRFFRKLLEINLTSWGHEVVGCDTGDEAWAVLTGKDSPKLAVLDWQMPGKQGVDVCREYRSLQDKPYVYIILLTAKSRREDLIEGLESGADDYLVKPFDPVELRVRVRAASRIVKLQEDLMAAVRATERQAREDPLTKLWNHTAIMDILRRELDRSYRQRIPLGVMMADVDNFKGVNDGFGHLFGDRVLTAASQVFRKVLRSYDSVGRYGGDEFLIVAPGCGRRELRVLAERLRLAMVPVLRRHLGDELKCSMSVGVALVSGRTMYDADQVVKAADDALYQAKRTGRNRVVLGTGPMEAQEAPGNEVAHIEDESPESDRSSYRLRIANDSEERSGQVA
jgi:diguanylate cyclase (GGDEF)-like protein